MAINKTTKTSNMGFWHEARKKTRESKAFFADHLKDLILSVLQAKPATKVIIAAVLFVGIFMMGFSMFHSSNAVKEKEQSLAALKQEIEDQKVANENVVVDYNEEELDEFVEYQARTRLDMVYPDEEVYINAAG